ncbi:MAG: hypothetical protein ACE5EH_11445 [Gammaproteobacteria bacterium]
MRDCSRILCQISVFVLLSVSLVGCGKKESLQQHDWLEGKWELTHNPENDDEDVLEFRFPNVVKIYSENGRIIVGEYLIEGNKVVITLRSQRRDMSVEFNISTAKDRLTYKSGAFYTKM